LPPPNFFLPRLSSAILRVSPLRQGSSPYGKCGWRPVCDPLTNQSSPVPLSRGSLPWSILQGGVPPSTHCVVLAPLSLEHVPPPPDDRSMRSTPCVFFTYQPPSLAPIPSSIETSFFQVFWTWRVSCDHERVLFLFPSYVLPTLLEELVGQIFTFVAWPCLVPW